MGSPPLIIGTSTAQHIEIDNNEILSKSNGTTPSTLYLQDSTGGVVVAGSGGLNVNNGNLAVSGTITSTGAISATAGSIWAGTDGNTAAERDLGVQSGAGRIYLYSAAATNGARGIWLTAHGTDTSGKNVLSVDTNNNTTFYGTLSGTATNATNIKIASGTNDKRYLVGVTDYASTNQAPYISAENKCYMQSGYLYSNGIIVNSVTTATGVVTRSSGCTLKSSTINIAGKVAQLNVVLTGPSGSQTDGTIIFVGTISNTAYRPKASARGCDTYGTSSLIGWITTGGEVNIRVMDAGTYNTTLEMAFTYIIP